MTTSPSSLSLGLCSEVRAQIKPAKYNIIIRPAFWLSPSPKCWDVQVANVIFPMQNWYPQKLVFIPMPDPWAWALLTHTYKREARPKRDCTTQLVHAIHLDITEYPAVLSLASHGDTCYQETDLEIIIQYEVSQKEKNNTVY